VTADADELAGAEAASGTAARRARREAQAAQAAQAAAGRGRAARTGPEADEPAVRAPAPTRRELDPDALAALEDERDFLLRSLDDLEREHDAGDVDDADYRVLNDDYTARAATVLRAIENRQEAFASVRRSRSPGRTWAIASGLVVAALVLGIVFAQASGRREAGQSVSGDIRQTTRDQLLQAQQLQGEGKLVEAIKIYDQVLDQQPANAQALAYKGWLLRLTSLQSTTKADHDALLARALEQLDAAVKVEPTYADARVFRAIVLRDLGRPQQALDDLNALQPGSIPQFMTDMVGQVRSSLEQQLGGGAAGTSVPGAGTTVPG
jgi:tetratricopeptide (TPR) repeat protein